MWCGCACDIYAHVFVWCVHARRVCVVCLSVYVCARVVCACTCVCMCARATSQVSGHILKSSVPFYPVPLRFCALLEAALFVSQIKHGATL